MCQLPPPAESGCSSPLGTIPTPGGTRPSGTLVCAQTALQHHICLPLIQFLELLSIYATKFLTFFNIKYPPLKVLFLSFALRQETALVSIDAVASKTRGPILVHIDILAEMVFRFL
jgi:hypothetical protein